MTYTEEERMQQRAYYCKVIGVPFEANLTQVTECFRRLAMEYRPDQITNLPHQQRKHAEEMFKLVQEAYEFLSYPVNFYQGELSPNLEQPSSSRNQVPNSKPESLSRGTAPGCTVYPIIGAVIGGVGIIVAATLFLWLAIGELVFGFFAPGNWLLAIVGGFIATVVIEVFGGIETVGLVLALIGAIMGLLDGIAAAVVALVTKTPGIETAILTAIIGGVIGYAFGTPLRGDSYWGLAVFCVVFNVLIGGIIGFMSIETWTDITGNIQGRRK